MITKELMVAQEKYTTKDGQEKTKWLKIGEIHEHNGKTYGVIFPWINLAAIGRKEGDSRLFFNMFDPKPKGEQKAGNAVSAGGDLENDIPF